MKLITRMKKTYKYKIIIFFYPSYFIDKEAKKGHYEMGVDEIAAVPELFLKLIEIKLLNVLLHLYRL